MRWVIGAVVFLCIPLSVYAALIDINTASVQMLDTLPGIGEAKARSIIDHRTDNGPFQTIDDIKNVSGIGDSTFANIQSLISVGDVFVEDQETTDDESETEDESTDVDDNNETISLQLPDTELSLELDAPTIAYVNQSVAFSVVPSGIAPALLDSLQFQWNFGDLSTDSEKEPSHVFVYPGEYVVTVVASYSRHEAIARHEITVLPVRFSITRNTAGDVQIHNNAKYEIDISGYTIVGLEQKVFPPHSMLLANGTVTIAKEELGSVWYDDVQLLDQEGQVVAAYDTAVVFEQKASTQAAHVPEVSDNFTFATNTATTTPQPNTLSANVSAATNDPKLPWTFMGLIALMGFGIATVYAGKLPKT